MRITVDIDNKTLKAIIALTKAIIALTGETKKSPAVSKALKEYIRGAKLQYFSDLIRRGVLDFPFTYDEIED